MNSKPIVFELKLPSKTFLLGEYLILTDGPAMVLTTPPYFTLRCQTGKTNLHGIHPASPAGKLYHMQQEVWQNWQVDFIDAHQERGGFGASSAQFAAIYLLTQWFLQYNFAPTQNDINTLLKTLDLKQLLHIYRDCAWQQRQGYPPSGADVIAQLYGEICLFDKQHVRATTHAWPFPDLCFGLIHTGNKLATHTHLTDLTRLQTNHLGSIMQRAEAAFHTADSTGFCAAINAYQTELSQQQLTTDATETLLAQLRGLPQILACKGCGALGADVVLFIIPREQQTTIAAKLATLSLQTIICDHVAANKVQLTDR